MKRKVMFSVTGEEMIVCLSLSSLYHEGCTTVILGTRPYVLQAQYYYFSIGVCKN